MKIKWTEAKMEILKDGYRYRDLDELAVELGCTRKALTRKAEKAKLFRAKNNDVEDGIKYCSFCKAYHPESHFYRDKTKCSGLKYACKSFYEKYKLRNIKEEPVFTTPLLNQKRGKQGNIGSFEISTKEKIISRPRNPVVIKNGIEGKVCNGCRIWKPLSCFGRDSKGLAGKRARCVECMKARYTK